MTMIDHGYYRSILGRYPTGVCVVTAQGDGPPVGMVVGSFTSVSLSPPLVGFLPDRRSSSWASIEARGRFCVNILADCQEAMCRRMTAPADQRFAGLDYDLSPGGAPILPDTLAWIDCDVHAVHEAGDHYFVMGEVKAMDHRPDGDPLLFLRGGYGGFRSTVDA